MISYKDKKVIDPVLGPISLNMLNKAEEQKR